MDERGVQAADGVPRWLARLEPVWAYGVLIWYAATFGVFVAVIVQIVVLVA